MRRRAFIIVLYGCLSLSVACQRERVAAPPAAPPKPQDLSNAKINQLLAPASEPVEKCRLGTALGSDGNVTEQQTSFRAGDPIRLTMWLRESPGGLQTSARWYDAKKKQIAREAKSMNRAKVVTFTLDKKLPPGKYHVIGVWGGNEACGFDFEVIKSIKSK